MEERLQLALNAARMGEWAWNIITGEVVWSRECLALYGLPPDTPMSYARFLQALHPEDRERVDAALRRAIENRTTYDEEKRTVWPDGSIHWTASRGQVYCDAANQPLRMIGVTFDVTERKRAEEEHLAGQLWYFESMDRVNRVMQGTNDLEQMMSDVLDAVLAIFDCDRAWLVYPCDPEAATWRVPMERTRPNYPGALASGSEIPMDAEVATVARVLRTSSGPVKFGPGYEQPMPAGVAQGFSVQSFIAMAVYPRVDSPYMFGLHQCSYPRVWTPKEERLFQEIGWRLADALNSLLDHRNLRESEERLRESERKLKETGQIAHVGYWERDVDAGCVTLSDEACRIFGISQQERTLNLDHWHERWLGLVHPEDRPGIAQAVADALRGGPSYNVDYRIVRPDGEIRFIHSEGEVARHDTGLPRQMLGTMQDITERKQVESALQQSQRDYALLVNSIDGVVWEMDVPTFHFTFVSRQAERILGYPIEHWLADANFWKDHIHPEDRDWAFDFCVQATRRQQNHNFDYRMIAADGRIVWIHDLVTVVVEFDHPAKLRGVMVDITASKHAEEALRETRERAQLLVEASNVGLWDWNLLTNEVFFSPEWKLHLGYANHELPDRYEEWESRLHPEDRKSTIDAVKDYIEGRRMDYDVEFRLRHKDGSWRWILARADMVRDAAGKPVRMMGCHVDITGRKQAEDRIQRLNRIYAVLSGINSMIVRVSDRSELLQEACRIAVEAGQFKFAWLGVVNRGTLQLDPVASAGADDGFLDMIRGRMSLRDDAPGGHGISVQAVREKRAVVVNDVANDPSITFKGAHADRNIRSVAILPLIIDGEPVGTLGLHSDHAGFFDEEEIRLLLQLAGDVSFALDHIEKANKLDYLAQYDALTGLANRTLFHERLSQFVKAAQQSQGKFALVLADVERFKTINDSLGRQAGDELLKQLAGRLGRATEPGNIARTGVDHFAIVLPKTKGRSEVQRIVAAIWRNCFAQSFRVDNTELRVAAKAGIALFPGDGADADALFANAEAALQKAQQTGERFFFHTRELTAGTADQLAFENRLRQALEKDEFVLHYQPKVDLETRRIVGVEALIRWQSPELGLVSPGKFIPLMEVTGLILEVGAWAMRQASLAHRIWVEKGLQAPPVAVNVSAIQLRQRNFVGAVQQAIAEGIAPDGIDLEITESMIMEDIEGNIPKLKEVRRLGMSIAIDDFGTGYSSLGYLAKLPVQALKIDRSFIITMLNDPDTMTLVQTIISLAHSLRLKVIAEGVESEDQAKILRLLRCDELQGYLYSKPIPFDEMTAMLKRETKS